jgi:two-component sensor histidine kinase
MSERVNELLEQKDLLLRELHIASLKRAYSDDVSGPIRVPLKHKDDSIELRFADSGRGLPDDFQIETTSSLGMKIIVSNCPPA